jgi:hypothetical protein
MKEELVSFETAKLLKEKGFVNLSDKSYVLSEGVRYGLLSNFTNKCNNSVEEDRIEAPTQSLAQKYLREKYGIHINVDFGIGWGYQLIPVGWGGERFSEKFIDDKGYNTYEEALEEGLKEGLTLIK